jgi:hypothetical protein
MHPYNLIMSLALLICRSYYLYYICINSRKGKEIEGSKNHLIHYDAKIAGSILSFVMIGIVVIYREIKKKMRASYTRTCL